jgi:hypothetical protein
LSRDRIGAGELRSEVPNHRKDQFGSLKFLYKALSLFKISESSIINFLKNPIKRLLLLE